MLGPKQTENQIHTSEHHHGGLATLGIGMAVAFDHLAGGHELHQLRTEPNYYVSQPDAKNELIVLAGCQMDGRRLSERYQAHKPNTRLVVADYPQTGLNIEQFCEGLANTLRDMRAERSNIVCHSMGGIVVRHFLEYANSTGLTDQMGGFGKVVLDDPIHDARDIRWPYNALLRGSIAMQHSWAADHIKHFVTAHDSGFSANAHIATAADQGHFILAPHPKGNYEDIVEATYFVHGPGGDHVANTLQSLYKFRDRFGSGLIELTDNRRTAGSHTAGPQHLDYLLELSQPEALPDAA